jgi:hypothetical protein
VNPRRVASFVDDLVSGRRPAPFKVDPADADLLGVAIALGAGRPEKAVPEEQFVARLREELDLQARGPALPPARLRFTRRARLVVAAAAAVTMMGGTVAATTVVEHSLVAASAPRLAHGQVLRMAQFASASGRSVGEIVAYRGDPSWVFMSIRDPGTNGRVDCRIQMSDGRTAATGTFVVHNGVAEFARTLSVDVGQFRQATLVTTGGSVLATANFPSS